ncbi:unnamed protein product [Didymodactylos carnosus]|uniref:Uncharacterized protein n=1 Tax=Didymodactylos carnosus TaxID=1234261 RepID=A0A813T8S5_9BILA|nr:unnamed protein product [Didymodactylos carnosus]CAF1582578.1 unnamed protein product [Didymodactylos carnosus]CAF3592710.1 unnamed protein product [Didymodactylos carnosus]CAF4382500.1 unnamed protein product [Didymodactylos carnosus]
MKLIQNQFGSIIYQRYINDIFTTKNSDYNPYNTDKDKFKFEKAYKKSLRFLRSHCNNWEYNLLNVKDNSNGIVYKRKYNLKVHPSTNELKMAMNIQKFIQYNINKYNYCLNEQNINHISLYENECILI